MTKKQRGWISVAGAVLLIIGVAYVMGFWLGFGEAPDAVYGNKGGLMGACLMAMIIAAYGVLGAVALAVFMWVDRGDDDR